MKAGKKIKLLRQLKGLTQEELAYKIGKTRALLSHIEKTNKINHETLVLILKAFKISMEEFEFFDEKTVEKTLHKKPVTVEDDVLKQLHEQLVAYKKENSLLKEIIHSQKELISVLKKKN
jgi:transcriptional regulator with XRE-family HTH domain